MSTTVKATKEIAKANLRIKYKCFKSAAECRFLHADGKKGTVPKQPAAATVASTASADANADHTAEPEQSDTESLAAAKAQAPYGSSGDEGVRENSGKRGRRKNKRRKKKKSTGDVHVHRR